MNHRVKNSIAMVHAMVSQTLRQADNLVDARASIQSRIGMMAHAHDRLVQTIWTETKLLEVIDTALASHRMGDGRFTVQGPDLPIGSKQALALTMALHELATNAIKYGSLSSEGGHAFIEWSLRGNEDEKTFVFSWIESNGPKVTPPTRQGFGSRMIEQALAGYFNGTAELMYDPDGLRFELEAPLSGLTL